MENKESVPPQTPQAPTIAQNPVQNQPVQTPPQPTKSSKLPLTILIVIVLLIVAGGVAIMYMPKNSTAPNKTSGSNNILTNISPTITQAITQSSNTDASSKDTSDTQLQKDIQNTDTFLNTANSNIQGVDQGLNDQPVNLTE